MQRVCLQVVLALGAGLSAPWAGAERMAFQWSTNQLQAPPPGFTSTVSGQGQPGDWRLVEDLVPSLLPTFTPDAARGSRKPVLAQLSRDPADEHFPLLIFEGEVFGDFKLSLRFKLQDGEVEQMAGVAFRLKDERNYYYVRASALGNSFYFFKVVDGIRSAPIGIRTNINQGEWHHMTVSCQGSQIDAALNGSAVIPTLTDTSFTSGKIAFWTKSDAVSYFTDVVIDYTPRVSLAQKLVRETLDRFDRLEGLKILAPTPSGDSLKIIASDQTEDIGAAGRPEEIKVLRENTPYYAKSRKTITMTFPLPDRNGDPVAAVRIIMDRFPGQTEKNAFARGFQILKSMESRALSAADLTR